MHVNNRPPLDPITMNNTMHPMAHDHTWYMLVTMTTKWVGLIIVTTIIACMYTNRNENKFNYY